MNTGKIFIGHPPPGVAPDREKRVVQHLKMVTEINPNLKVGIAPDREKRVVQLYK